MSNKTERMFDCCKKIAIKNIDSKNNHHFGTVLVKGGAVVSTGHNIPKRNGLVRFIADRTGGKPINIHAETSALLGVPTTKSQGATMYVARVKQQPNGSIEFKLGKPCQYCQDFMRKRKVKKVYYSISGTNKIEEYGVMKL
jgi:pyrimidine deaminase RibD-like protein